MEFLIRKAAPTDLDGVVRMYRAAITAMKASGIDQWDERYPNRPILCEDIRKDRLYLLTNDDILIAAFVIDRECDKQYNKGHWIYDVTGAAILHRLCVDPALWGKGYGKNAVLQIEAMLRGGGFTSLRLDAFSRNPAALRLYESLNYSKTGEVNFRKGLFFLYEKSLVS